MMRQKDGFTLVELIVAIAALAICSGFIVSMYFTSDDLSNDAYIYDEAMNQTSFIAETFKASTSIDNFISNAHLSNNDNETSHHSWMVYFNRNGYVVANLDDAYIVQVIELAPEGEYTGGMLYALRLNYFKLNSDEQENMLTLDVKKYYPGGLKR